MSRKPSMSPRLNASNARSTASTFACDMRLALHPVRQSPLLLELLQVRLHGQGRRRAQLRRRVRPGGVEQLLAPAQPRVERLHQPPLAVQAVGDVLVELRGR